MFLGDGDTSRLGAPEQKTLQHLRRMAETGHLHALSPKESLIAIEAINFYATVRSARNFLVMVRNVLILAGGLIAIWWAIQDGLVDILQKVSSLGIGG